MTGTPIRQELAELISDVTAGDVRIEDALAEGVSLRDMGMDSLGLLRLVDAIELRYGAEIDIGDGRLQTETLDALISQLAGREADSHF